MNKEELIALIKGPKYYAHESARHMKDYYTSIKRYKDKKFNKLADHYFENIMNWYSREDVMRISTVWLCHYALPFDPDLIPSIPRWERTVQGLLQTMTSEERNAYK